MLSTETILRQLIQPGPEPVVFAKPLHVMIPSAMAKATNAKIRGFVGTFPDHVT